MTQEQIMILLRHILDDDKTITSFKWMHTDKVLHIKYLDGGGNRFHRSFNVLGHFLEWED